MKIFKIISIQALSLFIFSASFCYGQNSIKQISISGAEYAIQGNYEEAKSKFKEALKINQHYAFAEEGLMVLKDVKENRIEAEAATCFFKSFVYSTEKKWDEAIAELAKAIEIHPMFAPAYHNRGKAYFWKKQFDQALSDHNKAIKINPTYDETYIDRGLTYGVQEKWDEAIADFNKAIELNPSDPYAYHHRGFAYYKQGHYDLAISDQTKAIDIEPTLTNAYYMRGSAYSSKDQHDKAIADYTEVIERKPQNAKAYADRGIEYFHLGIHPMACSDAKKACELESCRAYEALKKQGACEEASAPPSIAKTDEGHGNQVFYHSSHATQRIILLEGAGEFWFDPLKWQLIEKEVHGTMGAYRLQHTKEKDVEAAISTQSVGIPFSLMKEATVNSIQKADWHDAQILLQEERLVNGHKVLSIRWDAKLTKTKAKGYEFSSFEYNWSGRAGSIKVQAGTHKFLYGSYEKDIKELLNGLIIKKVN